MSDREFKRMAIGIGLGLFGLSVLTGVYRAGIAAGTVQDGSGAEAVTRGGGFFPFPLLIIGVGALLFYAWRRRMFGEGPGSGSGSYGRGPGAGGPPRFFEEWHRRAHEGAERAPGSDDRPGGPNVATERPTGYGQAPEWTAPPEPVQAAPPSQAAGPGSLAGSDEGRMV